MIIVMLTYWPCKKSTASARKILLEQYQHQRKGTEKKENARFFSIWVIEVEQFLGQSSAENI